MRTPYPGLCGGCCHCRILENRRGSAFHLCLRSRTDSRFRRYPPLPVVSCPGFEAGSPQVASSDSTEAGGPGT